MKLWIISQDENSGYDTYDAVVVCAETEADARMMRPSGKWGETYSSSWATAPGHVSVQLIGEAEPGVKAGVVLASFNAG